MVKIALYKYNKRTGYWDHERGFDDEKNGPAYLEYHKKNYPNEHWHLGKNKPKHNPTKQKNESNNGYRTFKEGPIHLVYAGGDHIGNVIEPTFGGADGKTQKFTAISRIWGRKTTHDSKHSAMEWLQNRHGSTMKIESINEDIGSPHDVLRDNEWKKPTPYGFSNHLAAHQRPTYVHKQFPGHRITASYTNDTWQHYKSPKDTTPHVGMGAQSLHRHLQKVHSSHTIDAIRDHVAFVKLNYDNWQEILVESQHQPLEEIHEEEIHGATSRTKMLKSIKTSKVKVVKKNPSKAITMSKSQQSIGEELEDLEKNQKDPKAGPQKPGKIKNNDNPNDEKQGPKPQVSQDAEGELTIKKTMTGEPGDTITINPIMQRFPNSLGGTSAYKQIQAPEHKKQVA